MSTVKAGQGTSKERGETWEAKAVWEAVYQQRINKKKITMSEIIPSKSGSW